MKRPKGVVATHGENEDHSAPASPAEPGAALHAILSGGSDVVVAALADGGTIVPMPKSVPLSGQGVLDQGLGLDLLVAKDQIAFIAGWSRAQHEPIVRLELHLLAEPERVTTVKLFDVRVEHEVHVLVLEAQDHDLLLRSAEQRPEPRRGRARAKKDATSVFLEVDDATTSLLGWDRADLIGHSSIEYVHPDDVERAIASWMAVRAGTDAGPVRVRYRRADGQHLWVEVTNDNRIEDPEQGCVLSEMVDVSAEMAQVEALRDRERLLARLADALPIGMCHIRPDLQVAYSNEPLIALLGQVDTLGALLRALAAEDRQGVETALHAGLDGTPGRLEVGVLRPQERRCELTFRPMTTGPGVDGVIVCAMDVTDQCRLRTELEHRAWHDPLTGCLNRAAALVALEGALLGTENVAVAFVDLDGFKAINDELGHATGDALLKIAAARLRGVTREGDRLARLGGDEFILICRQSDAPFDEAALVERLTQAIQGDVVIARRRVRLQASVGAAAARNGESDGEALLQRADTAMYATKRRNRDDAAFARRA